MERVTRKLQGNDIKIPAGYTNWLMEALERADITSPILGTYAKRVLEVIVKIV